MHLFLGRLGRADRQYGRESGTAMPRLRSRFRPIQAWRWCDGVAAQPFSRALEAEAAAPRAEAA